MIDASEIDSESTACKKCTALWLKTREPNTCKPGHEWVTFGFKDHYMVNGSSLCLAKKPEPAPLTVNIMPDWSSALNAHIVLLAHGDAAGRELATKELRRMAGLADAVPGLLGALHKIEKDSRGFDSNLSVRGIYNEIAREAIARVEGK